MTPGERWLAATWPFVRSGLPTPSARVVDLGCGPLGGFVPMLRAGSYDAVCIDPQAPEEAHYQRIEFERADLPQQVDAVIASTSLHHIADPAQVINRMTGTLNRRRRCRRCRVGLGKIRRANRGVVLQAARPGRRIRMAPSAASRMARFRRPVAELLARLGGARRASYRRGATPAVGRAARAPASSARALLLPRSRRHDGGRRAVRDRRGRYSTDPHRLRRNGTLTVGDRTSACPRSCSASVGILVLPPRAGLGRWGLWRSLEQEAEIRRDERVGRRHGVGVVDGPVLARKGAPARVLAQPVVELG